MKLNTDGVLCITELSAHSATVFMYSNLRFYIVLQKEEFDLQNKTHNKKQINNTDSTRKQPVAIKYISHLVLLLFQFSGADEDNVGSQFLTGCLEKIKVQEKDLDLDLAVKHMSISSHSCPA